MHLYCISNESYSNPFLFGFFIYFVIIFHFTVAMTPRGKKVKKKFKGWEAVIFQHEYDHLDGVVYIDRLADETREKVQPRLNELIEEYDGDDGAV
jgi:hypothetical protein